MKAMAFLFVLLPLLVGAADSDSSDKLTPAERQSVVLIEGDQSVGSGFLLEMKGVLFVVTNLHVLSGNKTLEIKHQSGRSLATREFFSAIDHDICLIRLENENDDLDFLRFEPGIAEFVSPGDAVVIPGNSAGGGTVLDSTGQVVGIGPLLVEHDSPTFPGNSGSPIVHLPSHRVIGVNTYVSIQTEMDLPTEISMKDERSAIQRESRHFGYRLDSVERWERLELARFFEEGLALQAFEAETEDLIHFFEGEDVSHHADLTEARSQFILAINETRRTPDFYAKARFVLLSRLESIAKREVNKLESRMHTDFHSRNAAAAVALREKVLGVIEQIKNDERAFRRILRLS